MTAIHELTATQLAQKLRSKEVSAVEIAQHFLSRGDLYRDLGAYLSVNPEVTLRQAREADERISRGHRSPLLGVPIAHKDVFVTTDFPTTAGSKMLAGYRSPFDSTVVRRLSEAGMVTLGKLNCDEFAMGSSNQNSAFHLTRNPWDFGRVPGGSSGGSAAAVAARLVPAATGTDTGGSVRQPAAFCGVTGIKPTYGRASRYGMVAFASSLDQAGVFARTAEDCALLLSQICGPDPDHDSTSLEVPSEDFAVLLRQSVRGMRIGVPREWLTGKWNHTDDGRFTLEGTAQDVVLAIDEALEHFRRMGATIVPISLPRSMLSVPVYYVIALAEASSNLSRFDGVRYGHRARNYDGLLDMYMKSRAEGFGEEVKRRIMIGTYVLSHGYYDAYYVQAQKVRRLIAEEFQEAFKLCDVIAGPVAPTVAWKLGEHAEDPVADYLADIFTLPASLAGLPGMSIPCGFGASHMPVGLQLIGNYCEEKKLLQLAHRFQSETAHHLAKPPVAEKKLRRSSVSVDVYRDKQLLDLVPCPESPYLERKEAAEDEESLRRTICAFANNLAGTAQPGVIFIGVADDGRILGVDLTRESLHRLERLNEDGRIQPLPGIVVRPLRLGGKNLVAIVVPPLDIAPVRYKQKTWVRTGPSNHIATFEEEQTLGRRWAERDSTSFDSNPVRDALTTDLNLGYFQSTYLPSALDSKVLSDARFTTEDRLVTTKMARIRPEGLTPTVAGILTLGLSPQDFFAGAYVQFVRYEGAEHGSEVLDQQVYTGNLESVILRTEEKLMAQVNTQLRILGPQRDEAFPTYPFEAIRQLFRNAVLHRTYERTNAPIRVYWFEDRVEIWNPGGPFGSVTVENFGEPYATDYRNPVIAEALANLSFVQKFGFGIQSAKRLLAENGNPPPEFDVEKEFVLVTVRRRTP